MNNNEKDYNYIECPDLNCQVWFEEDSIEKLCSEKCPGQPKLYIKCFSCGAQIYVELLSCRWARIDCDCGACNFQRMSGQYLRVNTKSDKK